MSPDETFRPESRARRTPAWCLEMFESPLLDHGITYTVSGGPEASGYIDFQLPTRVYTNAAGEHAVKIRLTVVGGRLSITAPGLYPPYSLIRTTKPPPDRDGNLRVARMGDFDTGQIDLMMAADGMVTAVLLMETIRQSFTRQDIVALAEHFADGVDVLDFVARKARLFRTD